MNRRLFTLFLVLLFVAVGVGTAGAQSSNALWFAKFWNNPDLKGEPVHRLSEGNIDHNWGKGAPAAAVGKDHWSAQWTTYVELPAGTYRFTATSDDGVRVYLGDKHIISDWSKHPARTSVANVSLKGGRYNMAVDYFDDTGHASLKLGWERTGPAVAGAADVTILSSATSTPPPAPAPGPQGSWYASYWNNTQLSGGPVTSRYEANINYDWGVGSPVAGVGADNWSARWTSFVYFPSGTYRFNTISDDGIRVYVHDRYVINNWTDHRATTDAGTISLPAGNYSVAVDYYDQTGGAIAKMWWERVGDYNGSTGGTGGPVTAAPTVHLRMRSGPGTSYPILTVISPHTLVPVLGRNSDGSWVQVEYRGALGWMSARYLTFYGNPALLPVTG